MSDFPPPPPPDPWVPPPPPGSVPPPSTPPPPFIADADSGKGSWLGRTRFHLPQWVWLLGLVALVAVVVAVALSAGSKDDKATSAVTTQDDVIVTTIESTAPAITDSIATDETSETVPATDVTEESTVPETVPAAANEVAGAPVGLTGDRSSPVPGGAVADIGGGWRLQVLNVDPDAAAAISAENSFNEPPPAGSTYTLVTVALGYFGLDDPKSSFETTISAVGASNVELADECGVVPKELNSFGETFSGGVVVGNLCFVTTPADAASLQVYGTGDFFGGDQVFIDASKSPSAATPMASLAGPQRGAAATPSRLSPTPMGSAADIGGGWQLTVTGPASDITDAVMAENQFNEPPPDGFRFVGVNAVYAYGGEGTGNAFAVTARAVGNANLGLSTECGVTPGEFDISADIFAGGSVTGTLCFVVPADSTGLVVYATADLGTSSVMFATA